ncbi:DUF2306 domain-containing protein [Cohnella zeiphila]|uniref:DUF2306 domain-containing protein n=1 Tax=Cohnella zeiphila TaxID=2761120 RepID=A0A7X0SLZ0_9BACL|nr:DUF2306 domain-containing protein [Cohnella zeiphila]MBB6732391.1 DUF2306 domain-containing protein [Cohnella zeiphila]
MANKRMWALVLVSFGIMIPFAAPYMTLNPAASRTELTSAGVQFPLLVAHIATAIVALASGFLQFANRLRLRRPKLHRYAGRIYVGSVIVSGLLSLPLVFYMDDFAKATSFLALAVLWMVTAWKGCRSAVRKDFEAHRAWMIRSFGFTLVAVSARALVPVLLLTYAILHGFSLPGGREGMVADVLKANVGTGLILNIAIVEWIVLRKRKA